MNGERTSLELSEAWRQGHGAAGARGINDVILDNFDTYQRTRGFSALTIRRRRSTLTRFCAFIHPKRLDRATLADIEEYLSGWTAARTKHAYRSDLRVFFKWAVARDLLPANPTELVDPIKVPRSLPRPVGPQWRIALLVGSVRIRQMVALEVYAGLRCHEVAALDVSDIADWTDPATLTVRNGKGGKDRVIPMHPALVDLLRARPKSGPMFPNRAGRPVLPASVSASVGRQLRRCGIAATPHQLRHEFCSEAARHMDLLGVAELAGHETLDTTRGYVKLAGALGERVAAMFSDDAA